MIELQQVRFPQSKTIGNLCESMFDATNHRVEIWLYPDKHAVSIKHGGTTWWANIAGATWVEKPVRSIQEIQTMLPSDPPKRGPGRPKFGKPAA